MFEGCDKMNKIYIFGIVLIVLFLGISSVSAGLFDGLSGNDNANDADSEKIPMETQEIDGLFKISAPVGSKFVYDYETAYGPSYTNKGEYDVTVSDIIYIPYDFDSHFPAQNELYEEDGDITVYQDTGMRRLYYVDRHIDGCTVSLMGFDDLDLLKEMANSIELTK